MNNKELFNIDVESNVSEENIILAPPEELFDEAKEIAQSTLSDEKFPFALQYDSNQKEFLLSMLEAVGAIVENDDDDGHVLATRMNMTQLAFIKQLDCVERVRTDEGINPFLAEEAVKLTPIQQEQQEDEGLDDEVEMVITDIDSKTLEVQTEIALNRTTDVEHEAVAVAEMEQADGDIAVTSVTATARSSCCPCPTNVSMETAATISDESYTSGHICCPGAEQWFKFVATRTGQYTICTTGNLDTVGTLYDCCGNQITRVDDYAPCGKINFRIICNLTEGNTYYVKVGVFGDDTGSYTLRITERVFANYVNINKSTITLEKGVTYELPITPNYTYKGYNGAQRIPGLAVSINPSNANEQKIWWWEQYGSVLDCSYGWDDDGDRYIHVTATGIGTAKLYAQDWNENGKRDECEVTCNTPGTDSVPEHSHIYNAVVSEDRNEYTFICTAPQCNESFTVSKDQVVGSYVTGNTNLCLGNSQTPLAYGIDVSKWQGDISQSKWHEIANTPIDGHTITFAILRIGIELSPINGVINRQKDEYFERNYERAKAAGLKVGCYYYTESWSPQNAITDAEQVIAWIGNKQFEYPIFFDIESSDIANNNNVPNNTIRTEICTAFMNKMREAGFFTGLYTNNNWIKNYLNSSTLFPEYDIWYARYYDNTPNDWQSNWAGTGKKFGMWQYTNSKKIAPISGNVDCNVAYKNYPLIIKALHLNNFN